MDFIRMWATFTGIMLCCVLLTLGFLDRYVALQSKLFQTPDTILFVQGKYYSLIAIIAIFAICLYAHLWWKSNKPYFYLANFKIYFAVIIAGYLLCGTIAEVDEFYHYARFTHDSLYIRGGILQKEKSYNWSQVKRVDVNYKYGRKYSRLNYIVNLDDGNRVELCESKNFHKVINTIDDIIKKNNIKMVRN